MSLFEFVATELSQAEKRELFADKTLCLCLFRVAFTALEQQLIYKLLFLNPETSPGIRPGEFGEAYLRNKEDTKIKPQSADSR